jgi:hypothetical protein
LERLRSSVVVALLFCAAVAAKPSASDTAEIKRAVQSQAHGSIVIRDVAEEGRYAVAAWQATSGHDGGQSVLEKRGARWMVLALGEGLTMNVAALEDLGIPSSTADALMNDVIEF